MMRYLFSLGIYRWRDHIGIRADEAHRALEIRANAPKYREPNFPLIEQGVVEQDVYDFWKSQSFDLQLDSIEGNCDLCFLKAEHKRIELIRRDPSSADWWENWEETFAKKPEITGDGKYFRKGQPYSLIRFKAGQSLFPVISKEDVDVPCGCGDKGFVLSEEMNCEL